MKTVFVCQPCGVLLAAMQLQAPLHERRKAAKDVLSLTWTVEDDKNGFQAVGSRTRWRSTSGASTTGRRCLPRARRKIPIVACATLGEVIHNDPACATLDLLEQAGTECATTQTMKKVLRYTGAPSTYRCTGQSGPLHTGQLASQAQLHTCYCTQLAKEQGCGALHTCVAHALQRSRKAQGGAAMLQRRIALALQRSVSSSSAQL